MLLPLSKVEDAVMAPGTQEQALPSTVFETTVDVCGGIEGTPYSDQVAEEVPVAMVYNGISHAVMMASPSDLEDFGLGFSLSEGIIDCPEQLFQLDVGVGKQGITLEMHVAGECFARLKEQRRNMAGRTGCGLCGTESLSQAVRPIQEVPNHTSPHNRSVQVAFMDYGSINPCSLKPGLPMGLPGVTARA